MIYDLLPAHDTHITSFRVRQVHMYLGTCFLHQAAAWPHAVHDMGQIVKSVVKTYEFLVPASAQWLNSQELR